SASRCIPPSELGGSIEACRVPSLARHARGPFRRVNSAAPLKLSRHCDPCNSVCGIPPSELGGSIEADGAPSESESASRIPPSELGGSIEARRPLPCERAQLMHSAE